MSDPVTKVDVEDVLSSIRRLVSDTSQELRPAPKPERSADDDTGDDPTASGTAEDGESDRNISGREALILTSALRVPDPATEPEAHEVETPNSQAVLSNLRSAVGEDESDSAPEPEGDMDPEITVSVAEEEDVLTFDGSESSVAEKWDVDQAPDDYYEDEDGLIGVAPLEAEAEDRSAEEDEDLQAELETWSDDQPAEDDPEPEHNEHETQDDLASHDSEHVHVTSEEEQLDTADDLDEPAAENEVSDGDDNWHEAASDAGDDAGAVDSDDNPHVEADVEGEEDNSEHVLFRHRRLGDEQVEPVELEADADPAAEPQDNDGDLVDAEVDIFDTQHSEADAAQPLGVDGLDESVIDEDVLRELVADIVRQELSGALGERITRNVRKLVRREIHRAMLTQEFD